MPKQQKQGPANKPHSYIACKDKKENNPEHIDYWAKLGAVLLTNIRYLNDLLIYNYNPLFKL